MSTRSTLARQSHRRSAAPASTSVAVGHISPRSSTPTRIHSPRSRAPPSLAMPAEESVEARPQAGTPLGKKRNTRRKRADARKPQDTPVDSSEHEADTPDEDLMELLGVPAEKEKGLLRVTKEDIDATKKPNLRSKSRGKKPVEAVKDDTPVDTSDPDVAVPRRSRRGKKAAAPDLGVAILRKGKPAARDSSPDSSSFDVSKLSQSLPPSFFTEHKDAAQKSSNAWEMPADAPVQPQPLNWQQQLVAEETPSKKPVRTEDRRRATKAQKAGGHDRRASENHVPASALTKMMKAAPVTSGMPISAFDDSIPFHTGYNVHRAPQTPMRSGASKNSSPPGPPGVISLPIVGDFPRINKAGGAPLGGVKYAGPTFHNSPASGALPKPDLDDF